jgi:hypothetical protein
MIGRLALAVALALVAGTSTAQAHFRLLKPTSWIVEDGLGDPQKSGPCGTTSGTPTNAVTTFKPGETITVEWAETIPHPGHFRIAVARDRSELVDPDIDVDSSCNYAPGSVGNEPPVYPVLLDNLYPRDNPGFGETFTHEVTLPDMECEKCTLQIIQFMTEHSQPCIYYHCADIAIVGDGSGSSDAGVDAGGAPQAGAGGTTGGSGAASGSGSAGMMSTPTMTAGTGGGAGTSSVSNGIGTGGMSAGAAGGAAGTVAAPTGGVAAPAAPAAASDSSGGCNVASHASSRADVALMMLALAALSLRRRRIH